MSKQQQVKAGLAPKQGELFPQQGSEELSGFSNGELLTYSLLLLLVGTAAGYAWLLYQAALQLEFIIDKKRIYAWFDFDDLKWKASIYISIKNPSMFDFPITKPMVEFALNGKKIGDISTSKGVGNDYNIEAGKVTDLGQFSIELTLMQLISLLISLVPNIGNLASLIQAGIKTTWEASMAKGGLVQAIKDSSEEMKSLLLSKGLKLQYKYDFTYYLLKIIPIPLSTKEWQNAY